MGHEQLRPLVCPLQAVLEVFHSVASSPGSLWERLILARAHVVRPQEHSWRGGPRVGGHTSTGCRERPLPGVCCGPCALQGPALEHSPLEADGQSRAQGLGQSWGRFSTLSCPMRMRRGPAVLQTRGSWAAGRARAGAPSEQADLG